jgi:hypothetical protein
LILLLSGDEDNRVVGFAYRIQLVEHETEVVIVIAHRAVVTTAQVLLLH